MLFTFALLVTPVTGNAQQTQKGGVGLNDSENTPKPTLLENESEDVEVIEEENNSDDIEVQPGKKQEMKEEMMSEKAIERRSQVANAVQEMEQIATRNMGIGEQIRVIAQNQNRIQEEAEVALQTAERRGGFSKFLIGPNYGQLKTVEERLANHTQNLEELKTLREQIQTTADKQLLDQQIQVMEQIKTQLEEAVAENQKGFSLFGWLNRILSK